MISKTHTFILAGGLGRRLHPLTAERAKSAVPFGGKYRIVDFTLVNCVHSGQHQHAVQTRMLVLTQSESHSLIAGARRRNCIVDKRVEILPGTRSGYHADPDRQRLTVSDGGGVVIAKAYRFDCTSSAWMPAPCCL